jgi:hypothetical protein
MAIKKTNKHDHNFQELWDISKRSNLETCGIEKGSGLQAKDTEDLFHKTIVGNFSKLGKDMEIQAQESFRTSNRYD